MMIWNYFAYFAITAVLLWVAGAAMAWTGRKSVASWLSALGLAVFCTYLVWMWITLERPPMRTMGETRLWYSFFLPLIGLVIYVRKGYKWVLSFSTLLATVFICVNLFKPEIHTKTMMPALQSPWFTPHVIVYMMAYYPVNPNAPEAGKNPGFRIRTNENVGRANRMVQALAREFGFNYIDVNDGLKDENGDLLIDHTLDGVHFDSAAYRSVFERLKKYL